MPLSEELLPRWFDRLLAFMGVTALATIAALGTFFVLLELGVGGDDFFAASIVRGALVWPVALGCGLVVGIVVTSAPSRASALRRAAATSLILVAAGVAAIVVWSALPEPSFSAAKFRAAATAEDDEVLEREAYRAVEQQALLGMTAAQLRRALGEPPRVGRRNQLWIWDLGMIHDFIGPGDGGALYVQFDSSWHRVRAAKVDAGF